MLTLNEGMPRSGKSYDAIKNHVLPALRQGREVYARLNFHPDSHDRIAQYLGLEVAEVKRLLHVVNSNEVLPLFVCTQDETGEYVLPEKFHNALIIIDECHEFYVSGKQPLPKEQHTFFAMHGHYGADILLMSQSFKDAHSGIRRRVERKACFQKLTAVGFENRYKVDHYQSTAPERYEKTETSTPTYEPEYFPLYKGFKEGAKTDVYEGGRKTVFQGMYTSGAIALVTLGLAGGILWHFWHSNVGEGPVDKADAKPVAAKAEANMKPLEEVQRIASKDDDGLTTEQRYVVELGERGRPRLAARIEREGEDKVLIEWREDKGNVVVERLNTQQLQAMGVTVELYEFGAVLTAGKRREVVTAWPTNGVTRDREATLYQVGGQGSVQGHFAPPTSAQPVLSGMGSAAGSTPRIGDNQQPIYAGSASSAP